MIRHSDVDDGVLRAFIKNRHLTYAGNVSLKIYGTLHCASGKRMKRKNRVFFTCTEDATGNGFRPCGHCMKMQYLRWKQKINHTKTD